MRKGLRFHRKKHPNNLRSQNAKRNSKASSTAIVTQQHPLSLAESIEKVLIQGDLGPLTPEDRLDYYKKVCRSLGLNYLTQPFTYILFREAENAPAKLSLYANKDCAAQLRKIHRISVTALRRQIADGMCMVEADVRDGHGKTDSATGVVPLWKWKDSRRVDLIGKEWANAVMKTETKAKRRATLSIAGLAFLDESELDTMQVLGGVTPDGRIYRLPEPSAEEPLSQLSEDAPHGHPEGSEKAKQAEAQLAKVEEEDRRLKEARNVTPASIPPEQPKSSPSPGSAPSWPILEAECVNPDQFIIRGDVQDTYPMIEHYCKFVDGWWRCDLANLEAMRGLQDKMKFQIKLSPLGQAGSEHLASAKAAPGETGGPTSSGVKGTSGTKPALASGGNATTSGAGPTAAPELVTGVIERITSGMTTKNNPTRQVKISGPWYTSYVNTIFAFLDKGVGKEAEVFINARRQIVGLKRIGRVEFDADGRTPCVQRNREPGPTLFQP